MSENIPTQDDLLPPDRIRGYARQGKEELESGKGLAHVNVAKFAYPSIVALTEHVDALWAAIDSLPAGPPWLELDDGKAILELINDLVKLAEPVLTPELKVRIAAVTARVAELTEEEEAE